MKSITTLTLLSTLTTLASADWQFRSRPDLTPPKLNITIPATADTALGYIFVAPYPGFDGVRAGPEQPAAYIFTDEGDLVWSSLGYFTGWVGNFQPVRYKGRPVLQAFQGTLDPFHGHGYGTPVLLDDHYQPVTQVQSLTNRLVSIHEFKIVSEITALVEVYQPTAVDLSPYGGRDDEQRIIDGIFQEIDIETGELLFEGHTLDWAGPDHSVIPLRSGCAFTGLNTSDAWDYFHINSVGGKYSDFTYPEPLDFGYQHDARFLNRSSDGTIETVTFFDNSARSDRQRTGGVDHLHPHSRARILQLNHTDQTASEIRTFIPPDLLSVPSQGNAQVLDNGNVFVNWGQAGAVTEFIPDGAPIFHAYLDSGALAPGVQSYRGLRGEWHGFSRERVAVVALRDGEVVTVYVSWNGDTVTECSAGEGVVFAKALGASGELLTTSEKVEIVKDVKKGAYQGSKPGREDL